MQKVTQFARQCAHVVRKLWRNFGYAACVATLCLILCIAAIGFRNTRLRANASARAEETLGASAEPAEEIERTPERLTLPAGALIRAFAPDAPVWSETLALYETHEGVDFAPGADGLVYACKKGVVARVGDLGAYGLCVTVAHEGGAESRYASLAHALVKEGERVRAGQKLGTAGDSAVCERALGVHLHFEWWEGGAPKEAAFAHP